MRAQTIGTDRCYPHIRHVAVALVWRIVGMMDRRFKSPVVFACQQEPFDLQPAFNTPAADAAMLLREQGMVTARSGAIVGAIIRKLEFQRATSIRIARGIG